MKQPRGIRGAERERVEIPRCFKEVRILWINRRTESRLGASVVAFWGVERCSSIRIRV